MKRFLPLFLALLCSSLALAQEPQSHKVPPPVSDNSILIDESANLKSDLAQLRSMLNVLASQEAGTDPRSFAVLQTHRQMWQVVIARLSELTQRIDALEQAQKSMQNTSPRSPKH